MRIIQLWGHTGKRVAASGGNGGTFYTSGNPNLSPDRTFRAADKAITGTVWVARAKSRPLRQTISRSRL